MCTLLMLHKSKEYPVTLCFMYYMCGSHILPQCTALCNKLTMRSYGVNSLLYGREVMAGQQSNRLLVIMSISRKDKCQPRELLNKGRPGTHSYTIVVHVNNSYHAFVPKYHNVYGNF